MSRWDVVDDGEVERYLMKVCCEDSARYVCLSVARRMVEGVATL